MKNLFTDHPATVDETYVEHMGAALSFAGPLFIAAFCCLAHALLPFMFEKAGSKIVTRLHDRMVTNRNRHSHHQSQDHGDRLTVKNPEMA